MRIPQPIQSLCSAVLIVAALPTCSARAESLDLSGLTAAAMLLKSSKDYDWNNIMLVVNNKSAAKFDMTRWKCIILNKSQPIH
jgi:hypothetical protein